MDAHPALQSWGRGGLNLDNPFPQFAEVRELAPVHKARLADGHEAWLILRYADAKQALNDPRFSKDMNKAMADDAEVVAEGLPGAALAQHVLTMDPPEHTRLRKLVAQAFTPARVERLRPRVQELVDDLCDGLAKDGPDATVDLVARFAFPLPYTVICELLGIPEPDRAPLGEAFVALFLPGTADGPPPEAVAGSKHIIDYLDHITAYKREHPANDLITALGQARDGATKLTQRELCSTLFQLFVAGHDTTASLIGNGMAALLLHPEQLARLKGDLSLVPAAVEEFLRYDAPVPHSTFRYAAVDTEIGGVTIPAGDQVLISIASANRDPARFADPDALDIGREDKRHVAFGHGIHFCLGAPLGRMEGQIAFTTLLTRFPDIRLAVDPAQLRWGHGDGLVLRGLNELPVRLGRSAVQHAPVDGD
jgi:cytochrome P450